MSNAIIPPPQKTKLSFTSYPAAHAHEMLQTLTHTYVLMSVLCTNIHMNIRIHSPRHERTLTLAQPKLHTIITHIRITRLRCECCACGFAATLRSTPQPG